MLGAEQRMRSFATLSAYALKMGCDIDHALHRIKRAMGYHQNFHSTKGQDRWIIKNMLFSHRGGFFVEVGAADGFTHSNSYVLERDYGWTGIAVEANSCYAAELRSNRKCRCVHACVDDDERSIDFFEFGFLSGIVDHDTDNNFTTRDFLLRRYPNKIRKMQTTTLLQILLSEGAPSTIDYLSLDVEGAEHRILRNFPFDRFRFECVTIERPTHALHDLLSGAGYILTKIFRYDGFYVSRELALKFGLSGPPFGGIARKFF